MLGLRSPNLASTGSLAWEARTTLSLTLGKPEQRRLRETGTGSNKQEKPGQRNRNRFVYGNLHQQQETGTGSFMAI